jgi:hypothetical protein
VLLAFVHIDNLSPKLCIIADKPDQFSRPVPVDSLPITDCAVCRLSQYESVLAKQDDSGAVIIAPVEPSRLYLTPLQTDTPGFNVKRVRVSVNEDGSYQTEFQTEKDEVRNEWPKWNPNSRGRST